MNLICPNCDCYIVSKRAHKKYCSGKKDSVAINGKVFFYGCKRKHEHRAPCLTEDMINELSEIVYNEDDSKKEKSFLAKWENVIKDLEL